MNPNDTLVEPLIFACIIILVFVLVGAVFLALARKLWRWKSPAARAPSVAQGPPRTRPVFWLAIIIFVAFMAWGFTRSVPLRNRPGPPPVVPKYSPVPARVLGGGVVVLLAIFAFKLFRNYDRDVSQAAKKASAGDGAGAIEDLRAAIAARGPSAQRLNGLGVLLGMGGDWPAALPVLREAFALNPGLVRGNLAFGIWKTGDPREASEMMAPLIETKNPQPIHLLNYGLMLLDLGRIDEGEGRIDLAETTLRKTYHIGPGDPKPVLLAEVAAARAKIAGLRGVKKDLEGFEEL